MDLTQIEVLPLGVEIKVKRFTFFGAFEFVIGDLLFDLLHKNHSFGGYHSKGVHFLQYLTALFVICIVKSMVYTDSNDKMSGMKQEAEL